VYSIGCSEWSQFLAKGATFQCTLRTLGLGVPVAVHEFSRVRHAHSRRRA
jgi:hypothetical protein